MHSTIARSNSDAGPLVWLLIAATTFLQVVAAGLASPAGASVLPAGTVVDPSITAGFTTLAQPASGGAGSAVAGPAGLAYDDATAFALGDVSGASSGSFSGFFAPRGADAATDIVRYDPQWASRQLAGQNFPGSTGWATTPGGRTLSAHAAERTFLGGPGRSPIDPGLIDDILAQGTRTAYRGANDTVRISAQNLCGRCYVVVDAQNTNHIVTVMVPK